MPDMMISQLGGDELMHVMLKIGAEWTKCLIDTGASHSYTSTDFVNKTKQKIYPLENSRNIVLPDKSKLEC